MPKHLVQFLAIVVLISVFTWGVVTVRNKTPDRIVTAAEDMGCVFIEQSFHYSGRFYIDCGNGNIRIIRQEDLDQ
jgi:hypothetical protein